MKIILLTGFEAFGGEKINPSWEAVKQLDQLIIDEYQLIARQLPCSFTGSSQRLIQLLEELQPQIVLNIGQAGGRLDISLERIAINLDDARIADNLGAQPIDQTIIKDAPNAYFTNLPLKAILQTARSNGIPASISYSAGTFVCNHVFYTLMHWINTFNPAIKGGFIHIPYLPEQAAALVAQPSMTQETVISGLKVIIKTIIATPQDISAVGGTIC
ncbi:MAG: pyroglutamyl-peptidase I [Neisseriaceae bacterium]|nr:MAG: pyroglutamyl-peptidase I [Neisseriaceae bacterium]